MGAQRVLGTGFNLVLLPQGGKIINLADLLDGVLGIEGMAVVICTVQNRLYNDVVFRAVRIAIDGIAEGKDS